MPYYKTVVRQTQASNYVAGDEGNACRQRYGDAAMWGLSNAEVSALCDLLNASDKLRTTLKRLWCDGASYRQVAAETGMSYGALRTAVSRAKAALREQGAEKVDRCLNLPVVEWELIPLPTPAPDTVETPADDLDHRPHQARELPALVEARMLLDAMAGPQGSGGEVLIDRNGDVVRIFARPLDVEAVAAILEEVRAERRCRNAC